MAAQIAEQQRVEQQRAEAERLERERQLAAEQKERERQAERERLEALQLPSTAQWDAQTFAIRSLAGIGQKPVHIHFTACSV